MEKTKRIITLFLAIVCALALCVTAGAADTSVITDIKTDCVVDAAGSCQITQTVTIDIAGTEDMHQGDYDCGQDIRNYRRG